MIDRLPHPSKEPAVHDDVPVTHQQAAERVRHHLVVLRGGAPFLSSEDARLLLEWLDEGVAVARILEGLERAAVRRRERRVRAPLELRHARRYLRATSPRRAPPLPAPVAAEPVAGHPLAPVLRALHGARADHPRLAAPLEALEAALRPRTAPDDLDAAVADLTAFWEAAWRTLGDDGRRPWFDAAREAWADALDDASEDELAPLLEEHARWAFRASLPGLAVSDLLRCLDP